MTSCAIVPPKIAATGEISVFNCVVTLVKYDSSTISFKPSLLLISLALVFRTSIEISRPSRPSSYNEKKIDNNGETFFPFSCQVIQIFRMKYIFKFGEFRF